MSKRHAIKSGQMKNYTYSSRRCDGKILIFDNAENIQSRDIGILNGTLPRVT